MASFKFSCLVSSLILCTHATANVQGMSSSELAAFAQSQSTGMSSYAPDYQQQQPLANNRSAQIAQENVELILSKLQSSYANTSSPSQSNYSVKNYNQSVPKVRKEVKIERQSETQVAEPEIKALVATVRPNVEVVGEPSNTDSNEPNNWISAVTKYESDVSNEESRLLATKPVIATQEQRGYAKQSFNGVNIQKASFSYQPNTYKSNSGSIIPSPNNRAPSIGSSDFYAFKPASLECVMEVANAYQVPAYVLLGIASQERGKNGQKVKNTDGSFDLGHFQLNTIHFGSDGYFRNIDMNDAKWRGCYNAELAAWLLRKHLLRTDKTTDFWTRVAGYHSWTPSKNAIYRKSVQKYAYDWQAWLSKRKNPAL